VTGRALAGVAAGVIAVVVICAGLVGVAIGGPNGGGCVPADGVTSVAVPITTSAPTRPSGGYPQTGRWDPTQVGNAATIVAVGAQHGLPARGWVIAVATAMQESSLRNLPGGDRDSVGLFQQRPSQGWGTPAQLLDPAYASSKFYATLVTIHGWQTMPLTEAAQAVQNSGTPDAYAKWEQDARTLVERVGSRFGRAMTGRFEQCVSNLGWALPAPGPVVSGWRTPDRPTHAGVDIGAPRGTTIRAAGAGTVVTVRCNVSEGTCATEGSPSVKGCGYYVDIDHGQGVTTRYCHQLRRPSVQVGQSVAAGQPIGLVGSSGNSSGPHLHFEVRINGVDTNPVPFLAARGVRIGQPV